MIRKSVDYTDAWYQMGIRKHERKLMLWNVIHKFFSMLIVLSGAVTLCAMSVIDDIAHWKLIWSTIVVSILVFSISVVMAKIPKPRLPMSLVIYQNKYVIKQALRYTLRPMAETMDSEYDSSHINNQCAEIGTVYLIARE